MRIPVDRVTARLSLHDGKQLEVALFLPIGEDVVEIFNKPEPFLPVATDKKVLLMARSAIAAIAVPGAKLVSSDDLPTERQMALVHLRNGQVVEGELRWIAPPGRRRTADLLNENAPCVVVHAAAGMTYIAKTHIAWIEEA
jgi:hypothetical protein